MRSRLLKRALIAFAVADLVPLGVLLLSFSTPLSSYLSRHGVLPLIVVRVACCLALMTLVALVLTRRRIDALLQRADGHVRRVVAAERLVPPVLHAPVRRAFVLGGAALVAVAAVGLAVTSPPHYRDFIREDGIIEYASTSFWFAAALCGTLGLLLDRRRLSLKLVMYAPFIAFALICGGEEISWGQRILQFQTPDLIRELNKQHEFNLHDIGSIAVYENLFFVGALVCCLALPLLLKGAPAWQAYLRHLNAPIVDPVVAQAFGIGLVAWLVVGIRFGTLGFSPVSLWGYYSQLDDELFEFFASYGFFALAALDVVHRLAATARWPRKRPVPFTVSY